MPKERSVVQNPMLAQGFVWDAWTERVEAARDLRFSYKGNVVEDDAVPPAGTSEMWFGDGTAAERDFSRTEWDPGAAGYTIIEAIALARSVTPEQRCLALQLLASVLDKALYILCQSRNRREENDKSTDWEAIWAYALGPEPELVLALRMALNDNHTSVVLACVKVIQCLLSCSLNEKFFDILENMGPHEKDIFTAPVFTSKSEIDHHGFLRGCYWKYSAKPSNIVPFRQEIMDDGTQDTGTIQKDVFVAGQDVVSGLVRMDILETELTAALEDSLVSVTIAIARHSPKCTNAILNYLKFVQTIVKIFKFNKRMDVLPSQISSVCLLKVLAGYDKSSCMEFVKNGTLNAVTWHLFQFTSSLESWVKLGKQNCKLSSDLMVEQLRLLQSIQSGCCISRFPELFPPLCLWLSCPSFDKLEEQNLICEFTSVSKEVYLVPEAFAGTLPSMNSQIIPRNESGAWELNWITLVPQLLKWERGIESVYVSTTSVLWLYSGVMRTIAKFLEKISAHEEEEPLPWLPECVPKIGLAIKHKLPCFSVADVSRCGKDSSSCSSFMEFLCFLSEQSQDEELALASVSCLHGITRTVVLAMCLIGGPRDHLLVKKAIDYVLGPHALEQLACCIKSNKRTVTFEWKCGEWDYHRMSNVLASHFRLRWLQPKRKSKAENGVSGASKSAVGLETIHEDGEMPNGSSRHQKSDSLFIEWAHQRLPLPPHWFLSSISAVHGGKSSARPPESTELLEIAKAGIFFFAGLESSSGLGSVPSRVVSVPLVWKFHSLSTVLLVGMDIIEDQNTRNLYNFLQELYGQVLDETRQNHSETELLMFKSDIHDNYSTFLEQYRDLLYGTQMSTYLHQSVESFCLSAWTALSNARVLGLLPSLDKCLGEAEGYLEPVEENEGVLEAYLKSWTIGALDRAATRGFILSCLLMTWINSAEATNEHRERVISVELKTLYLWIFVVVVGGFLCVLLPKATRFLYRFLYRAEVGKVLADVGIQCELSEEEEEEDSDLIFEDANEDEGAENATKELAGDYTQAVNLSHKVDREFILSERPLSETVIDGFYEARPVLVRCSVIKTEEIRNEIDVLCLADGHNNILRYHGSETVGDLFYYAMEPWHCTLHELIRFWKKRELVKPYYWSTDLERNSLWTAQGDPSSLLINIIRGIVMGMAHLHYRGIIIRDLRAENIMIISDRNTLVSKIDGLGIALNKNRNTPPLSHNREGDSGWRAPEQLLNMEETTAVDMFNLGILIFYCITGGHPFTGKGSQQNYNENIKKNQVRLTKVSGYPEALNLIENLLDKDPGSRLSAEQVLNHPFFWNNDEKLNFISEVSDHTKNNYAFRAHLTNGAKEVVGPYWGSVVDADHLNHLQSKADHAYVGSNFIDLLRAIRNTQHHFDSTPWFVKNKPDFQDGVYMYFASRFPGLLIHVHKVVYAKYRREVRFRPFFNSKTF